MHSIANCWSNAGIKSDKGNPLPLWVMTSIRFRSYILKFVEGVSR
jgi:hypothetical protein